MITGKPRRRSSARFLRVARRWACDATRASGDILLSGIGFSVPVRFAFIGVFRGLTQIQVCFGKMPKPARYKRALPGGRVFAWTFAPCSRTSFLFSSIPDSIAASFVRRRGSNGTLRRATSSRTLKQPGKFQPVALNVSLLNCGRSAHPAIVFVSSSRRCCRSARSCFNCRSTRTRRSSDGPIRAKFHESSRPASTRLNSNARTDRVNSLRTD
jgi:hypothetical protein